MKTHVRDPLNNTAPLVGLSASGETVSSEIADEALKALKAKTGKDFDVAFLQHEVTYHKNVIDAVTTTLLPAIKNAELKELVVKVAPAFQAHMEGARSLLDRISHP